MTHTRFWPKIAFIICLMLIQPAATWAGTEGSISGVVQDPQGVAVPNAKVQLLTPGGTVVKEATTDATGGYSFFPVQFGDYQLKTDVSGFAPYTSVIHVSSGSMAQAQIDLQPPATGGEMLMHVEAKRHIVSNSAPVSSTEVTHQEIETLPEGTDITLPSLIQTTSPGVVQGPFNQLFIRGNHANIQYQIDGVQLPDSVSGTFAEAFSTRNIDHMEIITGGLPAEYGERLAAVVNIVTKTGPEEPNGSAEVNYGSYNTFNPQAMYGGSNKAGDWHYFLSASYNRTDRGLDTPQPSGVSYGAQQLQGTTDAVHDQSNGNNQFMKIDWLPGNDDKISFIAYQNYNFYQIPNIPSAFSPQAPLFSTGFSDIWQNGPAIWTPPDTDDTQSNQDAYAQAVWKHSFGEKSFLQLAPYWKYSKVKVTNDPANDLAAATNPADFIPGSTPDSFNLDRHVNNLGLKTDYSMRPDDRNLIKAGFQLQASQANDGFGVSSITAGQTVGAPTLPLTTYTGGGIDRGYSEDVYLQDDFAISKQWSLNLGLRYTNFQFHFPEDFATYDQWQPRAGLSYMPDESTKLHLYYGRLFQPAPLEDLREAFTNVPNAGTAASFYDIKPEKDNYFEVGVARQITENQVVDFNVYYKNATDMLDDTQLLNTAIASPYNYEFGYAYGAELSLKGKITRELSDYFNYAYETAKGENISGGSFTFPQGTQPPINTYLYLDHVQVHTANYGLTYATDQYFGTVQGLYGSGLRTGPFNAQSLPEHFSYNLTLGYIFRGDSWLSRWKVQGDILNIFNNIYPITVANGFNGSHYAAGRELFIRLTKQL